ncbi:uncharacterized protein LOC100825842 isoform X2 [Brachypodium distachyon]|nr:uncharacterized protein LOC100825842 isoform X2 [Brachypodium distachyon]XP_024317723.1 uncharacterized protein LOC100825842 isoform X2 [Brachypodium distachyon]|eukprot:XP_003574848.1 uncharacterized protein LOC100825842 isoform X2 [Brachypodium distachyon]
MKMALLVMLLIPLLSAIPSQALRVRGHRLKSKTFRSPAILLSPGSVSNKYYYDIDFPRGHIALKSFRAEVVDEDGVPVPLHETYLHHWIAEPYYALKNNGSGADAQKLPTRKKVLNDGVCNVLGQYFGLGSETRHTATWVPDPYGIEAGNPEKVPKGGYEEKWFLNVHAIDTSGVIDKLRCTECECGSYNVTVDEDGITIPKNYTGGLFCCYDQTQCQLIDGFGSNLRGAKRKLFLQYTVTWLDWTNAKVVPVRIYIFDATDTALLDGTSPGDSCQIEYQVKECSPEDRATNECIHAKTAKAVLPRGGDVVFGVAHQHSGGSGSSLHDQDGRLLCESLPTYGTGKEAGNEAGYVVGMSTCYPKPGSVKVSDGEVLTVVSNYSSYRRHTGVMGLFYILVAEPHRQ